MFQSKYRHFPLFLLVVTLIILAFTLTTTSHQPAQAQAQPILLTTSPLEPDSNYNNFPEKENSPSSQWPSFNQSIAQEIEVVSIIVTFDDTVDTASLEAISGGRVIHEYSKLFRGASLVLPVEKVTNIAALPGITGIYPDELLHPDTDTSPAFIGATTAWEALGGQQSAGEGIVVGVLDTGVWPEHPSFSDPDPFGNPYPDPPGGPYACEFGSDVPGDEPFECNNKLIGAYRFMDTYEVFGPSLLPGEFRSARDDDGHGTHTASTAVGNGGVLASVFGFDLGTVSGIAPRAHLIAYKVCGNAGCFTSDSVAAVEQAILDGVDVINFSISGGTEPFSSLSELAFLKAYENGVFVAASAGNSGPTPDTVNHRGPWVTTVAASSHNRSFASTLTVTAVNGDKLTLDGVSITDGHQGNILLASDFGDGLCLNPFPADTFTVDDIVVCERGEIARVQKSFNVAAGGAGGMILYNPTPQSLVPDNHFIPTIHIQNDAGAALLAFMATHTGVTGEFTPGTAVTSQGDVMAPFSSRGGPGQTLGISKPDITAPGIQILAGHTPLPATTTSGPSGQLFQAIAGTSMSSPHIAGAAALLKARHPNWTPGQIKSALMTTALTNGVVKEDGLTPADPFDYGSGRVDLTRAGDPGLTISADGEDFINHQGDLWNTNYPSIFIPAMPGKITVQRTVQSELPYDAFWQATVESPPDLSIKIERPFFGVRAGKNRTLTIRIDASLVPIGEVRHATIFLTHENHQLHIPVTIVRQEPVVTLDKQCNPPVFPYRDITTCTLTLTNTSFNTATVHLEDTLPRILHPVGVVTGGKRTGPRTITFDGTLAPATPPLVEAIDGTGTSPAGYLPLSLFGVPPIGGVSDESLVNFTVPAYVYAGETYTSIGMVSNGYLVVGGGDNNDIDFVNQTFPDPARPNNVLAPFWTDLNPGAGGAMRAAILSDGTNSWVVLDWENVPNFSGGALNSFQAWIGLNGVEDISFTYGTVSSGNNNLLTIGAENRFGNQGSNWFVNGEGNPVTMGSEVRIVTTPGSSGESHTVIVRAIGWRAGEWTNCAEMTSDLFVGVNVACFSGEVIPRE